MVGVLFLGVNSHSVQSFFGFNRHWPRVQPPLIIKRKART